MESLAAFLEDVEGPVAKVVTWMQCCRISPWATGLMECRTRWLACNSSGKMVGATMTVPAGQKWENVSHYSW